MERTCREEEYEEEEGEEDEEDEEDEEEGSRRDEMRRSHDDAWKPTTCRARLIHAGLRL